MIRGSLAAAVLIIGVLSGHPAQADEMQVEYRGPSDWSEFDRCMKARALDDERTGMSYILSGTLAALGGIAGYRASDDPANRGIYALTQSVGFSALGYGAAVYLNGNNYNSFYRALRDAPLTAFQKTEILERFLREEKRRRENTRWIRVGTHSVLALVNLMSVPDEKDEGVRRVLQFLGGVNAVFALSYAFDWEI